MPPSGVTPGMRRPVRTITLPSIPSRIMRLGLPTSSAPSGVIVAALIPSPASDHRGRRLLADLVLGPAAVLEREVEGAAARPPARSRRGRAGAATAPAAPGPSGRPGARLSSARTWSASLVAETCTWCGTEVETGRRLPRLRAGGRAPRRCSAGSSTSSPGRSPTLTGRRVRPPPSRPTLPATSPICSHCGAELADTQVLLVRHRGEARITDAFCSVDHMEAWAKAGGRFQ